jgi:hypothetical protein
MRSRQTSSRSGRALHDSRSSAAASGYHRTGTPDSAASAAAAASVTGTAEPAATAAHAGTSSLAGSQRSRRSMSVSDAGATERRERAAELRELAQHLVLQTDRRRDHPHATPVHARLQLGLPLVMEPLLQPLRSLAADAVAWRTAGDEHPRRPLPHQQLDHGGVQVADARHLMEARPRGREARLAASADDWPQRTTTSRSSTGEAHGARRGARRAAPPAGRVPCGPGAPPPSARTSRRRCRSSRTARDPRARPASAGRRRARPSRSPPTGSPACTGRSPCRAAGPRRSASTRPRARAAPTPAPTPRPAAPTATTPHTTHGDACSASGSHHVVVRSTGVVAGRRERIGGGPERRRPEDRQRGAARGSRATAGRGAARAPGARPSTRAARIPTPIASGSAMCTNRFRKKKAPGTGRSPAKMRPTGSESTGSTSNRRAPATASRRPKLSHAITKPVQVHASPTPKQEEAAHPGPRARPPLARLTEEPQRMQDSGDDEEVGGIAMQRPHPAAEPGIGREPRHGGGGRADPVDEQEVEPRHGEQDEHPGRERAALVERVGAPAVQPMHDGVERADRGARRGLDAPQGARVRRADVGTHLARYLSYRHDICNVPPFLTSPTDRGVCARWTPLTPAGPMSPSR